MFESKLLKEGEAYAQRAYATAIKESAIMESIKSNDSLELQENTIVVKSVNENYKAIKSILETFNTSISDEVYRIVEMTQNKFNTNFNFILNTNSEENALGESVVFSESRAEYFQVVTNDLDCIATIISEALGKNYTSLISVDKVSEAEEVGFDKSTNKSSEVIVFTFEA